MAFIPLTLLAFATSVARPILTSMLTKSVSEKEVGSVLGVNNSLTSVVQIITPIAGGAIIQYLPSSVLPLASTLIFCLIFIFWKNVSKDDTLDVSLDLNN